MGLDGLKCSPEGGLRGLVEASESILEDRRMMTRKILGRVTEVRRLVDPQSRTGHPLQGTRIL